MSRFLRYVVLTFALFYIPVRSMGWGLLGHRIIGEIAESYLTNEARQEIRKILGSESIALAGNWADFIKSDTTYKYINTWHYIDFEEDMDYFLMQKYLRKDTIADAYTKLNFLAGQLRNKHLSMDKKRMYLRLLIHIVEDIHQPLHVSKSGDQGGNEIKVQWFGQNSNLHKIWDEQLIDDQKLSYTEYARAINNATYQQRNIWQKERPIKWIYDSYKISLQLHSEIIDNNQKLGYLYNFKHIQILNDQLLKGGIHLAKLLNSIFAR